MLRLLLAVLALAFSTTAQTDSDRQLLGRVRQHVSASLDSMANYTCQETMERSVYTSAGQPEFRERLRLEVLFTDAGELFAWPDSAEFAAKPIDSWIQNGAIGNGNFATELHNLFEGSALTVKYAGVETAYGHDAHRFDFSVPGLSSRHSVMISGKSATLGYSGSFWVDRNSLDIFRFERQAENIPPDLDCREERETVTYGRISIGDREVLLPVAAELVIVTRDGRGSRNAIAFRDCRQYTAESKLSFETATVESARPLEPTPRQKLPAGVSLVLRLEQPVTIGESAAGDPVVARLDRSVTSGSISLPKGTRVLGRIRRLEQHLLSPRSTLVGLEFFAAESAAGRVAFSARLVGPREVPGQISIVYTTPQVVSSVAGLDIEDDGTGTGVGTFRVTGKELRLPRNFRTSWEIQ